MAPPLRHKGEETCSGVVRGEAQVRCEQKRPRAVTGDGARQAPRLGQLPTACPTGVWQYSTLHHKSSKILMQTMKKQSTKTTRRMRMRMTTTTVQLAVDDDSGFFDLVHVAFLAPLRVRHKSPVDLAPVVSAASLVGASRKSASLQRSSVKSVRKPVNQAF